ncbi:MAG TPA: VCBS repeat-containing protein, partial [Planctomycetaceae bacterium]
MPIPLKPYCKSWILFTALVAATSVAGWFWGRGRFQATSASNSVAVRPTDEISRPATTPRQSATDSATAVSKDVPGPIHFTDVTGPTGIDFVHVSGDSSEKPFPAANGSGVGAFDFDLDGQVDLYFLTGTALPIDRDRPIDRNLPIDRNQSGPINRCYRNLGDWQFQDVTGSTGLGDNGFSAGVAVGDFDSDGFPDVFISSFGPHRLYRNAGDGTFSEVGSAAGVDADAWGTSAAFLDYDGDGLLDLYVCHYALWTMETNHYCGDRLRGTRIFCNPTSVEAAPHILFHNEGDGRFRDASLEAGIAASRGRGQGVVAADVNGDGLTDLYVANDLHPNLLFLNLGGGRFSEVGQESGTATDFMGRVQAGMGVDAADLNRDGRIDLFVTNYEGEHNSFYENLGENLFQEVSRARGLAAESIPWVGWGTALADFDLDGWPDVVVTNGHTDDNLQSMGRDSPYAQPPGLWHNVAGQLTFIGGRGAGDYFFQDHVGRGLAIADLDNDGDLDLVITHQNDRPALLRNDCLPINDRPWIRIQLTGTLSNRDAVGAEIILSYSDAK